VRAAGDDERIERFCKTTRCFHWTFALSFLGLAATGGALLGRESLRLDAAQAQTLLEVHQWIAIAFLGAPWLVGFSGDTRRWLSDLAELTRFGRHDLRWLLLGPLSLVCRRIRLPEQDKLNAGQKLNGIVLAVLAAALSASGLHLWREPGAFAALAIHTAAFAVWIPWFAFHFFMAVLNPGTRPALRGMLAGHVSRRWAEHHHKRWVDELGRPERTD
jgi:formate dehydrogenase subunit gamma